MADTRITDAEISGYMGWRGPGAYTEASLRKIREIIDHVLRAERATPPSPSTAPELSVEQILRLVCEHTGQRVNLDLAQLDQYIAFARAANALRPRTKLDPALKEALDEAAKTGATSAMLPSGEAVFINRGHDYGDNAHLECTACGGSGHIDDQRAALASRPAEVDDEGLPPLPPEVARAGPLLLFTADQYRQGQRDAVAADRARRSAAGGGK